MTWFDGQEVVSASFAAILVAAVALLVWLTAGRSLAELKVHEFIAALVLGFGLGLFAVSSHVSSPLKASALTVLAAVVVHIRIFNSRKLTGPAERSSSEPVIVFHGGTFIDTNLKKCKLTEDDVLAEMRAQGVEKLTNSDTVVANYTSDLSHYRTQPRRRPSLKIVGGRES